MLDAVLALNETDTKVFDFASQAAPPAGEPAGHITVPDAHLLFNGEFKRVGANDLKIVGDDGASFFIRDYFAADKLSHLISPEGATLSASVVAALAGPLAPGQSAQAGAQTAEQPVIGRVDALSGSCTVVRNGVSVALNIGDTVRKGDVVQTAGGSAVAIVFADGSTFSLNANARMVLDEFVYNAGGTGNSALISLVQGTFSFVAGQVAKTGDMRVDTPVATMGIRGTAVLVEISANDGQTRFSVMVEPDGTTGSFTLYDKTSGSVIGTVNNSQIGWLVTPAGPLQVVAQQLQKTPAQLQQELGIVQQIFTIFNNNQQNPFVPDQQQDPNRRGDNPNDPNPQTAQGGGGGSGGVLAGGDPSESSSPGIVNNLPPPGTHVIKLPPLPGAPPPVIPEVVTVVVTPNAPPVAVDDTNNPPEPGGVGSGDIIENDSDPEGSVIVVTAVQHIAVDGEGQQTPGPVVQVAAAGTTIEGTYGTLTIKPDGTYTFSPNEAFDGLPEGATTSDLFQYTISDPFGATATAVLTINLTGVNDAPVITGGDTNGSVTEDSEGYKASGTLTKTDIDNDDNTSNDAWLIVAQEGQVQDCATKVHGTYGTLTIDQNGSWTYEIDNSLAATQSLQAGDHPVETFTVVVTDSHGVEATPQTISITVNGADDNHAPSAVSDSAFVLSGDAVVIDVLANDTDIDGDSLEITGVGTAAHGCVSITEDGKVIYTPVEGFSGTDSFSYIVTDTHGATTTGHVSVVVGGDVFLQGNYMEVGVSNSGSLGTASAAPQSFHPNYPNLSFVFDADGFDTGTPPTSGDVTLPGTPEDSIVIGHDGQSFANDERHGIVGFSTETFNMSADGVLRATTFGETADGLAFTQVIEFKPNDTYFTTTVTLTNNTDDLMEDVRFMRSFDPDQDIAKGGVHQTYNDVLSNPTECSDLAVAQATGTQSGVSVNLVSFDGNARASNFGFTNHDVYNYHAYDEPADAEGSAADIAIAMTFDFDDLAAGESATGTFYTSFQTGTTGTAGNDLLLGTDSSDIIEGNAGNDILIGFEGGEGGDTFVFKPGSGQDTIVDFGESDHIDLQNYTNILDFENLQWTISGNDTLIDLGDDNTVTVQNSVYVDQELGIRTTLTAADFIFNQSTLV